MGEVLARRRELEDLQGRGGSSGYKERAGRSICRAEGDALAIRRELEDP